MWITGFAITEFQPSRPRVCHQLVDDTEIGRIGRCRQLGSHAKPINRRALPDQRRNPRLVEFVAGEDPCVLHVVRIQDLAHLDTEREKIATIQSNGGNDRTKGFGQLFDSGQRVVGIDKNGGGAGKRVEETAKCFLLVPESHDV